MTIYIGSDENGDCLRESLKEELEAMSYNVVDYNKCFFQNGALYPDIADGLCKKVLQDNNSRGILICGTGIGMCISANKVPGIRAAVCHDVYSAERSMKSNNCQVMCMGAQIIGSQLAKKLVDIWVKCYFEGGRSIPKVDRINYYDKEYRTQK